MDGQLFIILIASITTYLLTFKLDICWQKLIKCGIPNEILECLHLGFRSKLQLVVSSLLPGVYEVNAIKTSSRFEHGIHCRIKNQFCESIECVQWLMFEDPRQYLMNSGSRVREFEVSVGQFRETMTLCIGARCVSRILPMLFVFIFLRLAAM